MDLLTTQERDMFSVECREKTFPVRWPFKNGKLKKDNMAQVGFYYVKDNTIKDCVRCAFCDIQFFDWEPNDDPFEEHLNNSPDCEFAKARQRQDDMKVVDFFKCFKQSVLKKIKKHLENPETLKAYYKG